MDVYAHLMPGPEEEPANRIDARYRQEIERLEAPKAQSQKTCVSKRVANRALQGNFGDSL